MFLFFTVTFGYVLAEITSNVLFVERVGAQYLPYIYIANAFFGFVFSMLVASVINKISITRLMQITAFIGGAGLFAIFLGIQKDISIVYAILFVFTYILYILLQAIFIWDLALKMFTPFEAKRNFGYFSFGASMGGILAGSISIFLTKYFSTETFILFIIASLAVAIVTTLLLNIICGKELQIEKSDKPKKTKGFKQLKEGLAAYKTIKIAKLLSIGLVLFYVIKIITDYEFQKIISDSFDEQRYTEIMGFVSTLENIILGFVFLFLQRFIFKKFGVVKALKITPQILLAPLIILIISPIYLTAAIAKIVTKFVHYTSFTNSIKLMYTAIPKKVRSSVSAFIGSISKAAGALFGGIGLGILTRFVPNLVIIIIAAITAVVLIFVVIKICQEFKNQIKKNLASKEIDDVHSSLENFVEPAFSHTAIIEIMKFIDEDKEIESKTIRKALFSLGKINNVDVIPSVMKLLACHPDITIKYSIIDMVNDFTDLQERLKDLPFTRISMIKKYRKLLLSDTDPFLKTMILENIKTLDINECTAILNRLLEKKHQDVGITEKKQAIKTLRYFHDRGIIELIKPFLESPDLELRTSSIIALWQFQELRMPLLQEFIKIKAQTDKKFILANLEIIAELNMIWEIRTAEEYLESEDEEIKIHAAATLLMLGKNKGNKDVIKVLTSKSPHSQYLARKIKSFPIKVQKSILSKIKKLEEDKVKRFIKNLKNTYYNYTDEIKFLKSNEVDYAYNRIP
ncbi:Npt1/Npt2 family nucleotide transporter [Patescibacteria group bacterium]